MRDAEPGLQVVAPLDFPAEGVVLLTSDGELAQTMAKKGRVQMTYHIKLQGLVEDDAIERLRAGLALGRPPGQAGVDRSAGRDRTQHLDRDGGRRSRGRAR